MYISYFCDAGCSGKFIESCFYFLEGVYMRLEVKISWNETSFHHVTKCVYISFHCGRNEINLFFLLAFWSTFLVFLKYLDAYMFPSEWFHFSVVFTWHLSPEMKFNICQNDRIEIKPAVSFISGYFMQTVKRG